MSIGSERAMMANFCGQVRGVDEWGLLQINRGVRLSVIHTRAEFLGIAVNGPRFVKRIRNVRDIQGTIRR